MLLHSGLYPPYCRGDTCWAILLHANHFSPLKAGAARRGSAVDQGRLGGHDPSWEVRARGRQQSSSDALPRRLGEAAAHALDRRGAELVGIGRNAAYRAAAAGELPAIRIGRRLRVPTARLLELLGIRETERQDIA
jgi:excisionase family DNA binding protein